MEEDIKEILTALDNTTKKQLDEAIANADKEWSEMELEEDIKILEDFVNGKIEQDKLENYKGGYKMGFFYTKDIQQAIEHLIERNKELEEKMNFVQPFVTFTHRLVEKILEDNDYIPKSKVREKIEELEKDVREFEEYWSKDPRKFKREMSIDYYKLEALKELLEGLRRNNVFS